MGRAVTQPGLLVDASMSPLLTPICHSCKQQRRIPTTGNRHQPLGSFELIARPPYSRQQHCQRAPMNCAMAARLSVDADVQPCRKGYGGMILTGATHGDDCACPGPDVVGDLFSDSACTEKGDHC
jgi:hypothetical protein